jgi:penicillin amidase
MEPENAAHISGKPGTGIYRPTPVSNAVPNILPRPLVLQTLLTERPVGWVSKNDWDRWLESEFGKALNVGRDRLGSPVSKWKWGRVLEWNLQHQIGKALPVVNRFFDIGPVAMSGCSTCVKQTTGAMGPSERMVVDLGDLDKSVQNLTVGESGHVASSHYRDQWSAFYNGNSFPMQFDHIDAKDVLTITPSPR